MSRKEKTAPDGAEDKFETCRILKASMMLPAIMAILLYFVMSEPAKFYWPLILLALAVAGFFFGTYLEHKGKKRK